MPLAFSVFGPVEALADALTRMVGLDPVSHAGAATSFFVFEFIKVSVLILAISWLMGLVRHSLPLARVRTWLTTPVGRALGYPAAAGFGAVTPFCSCSSVPLFIGFVEAGIPLGVTYAFLITSPLVNEIVVALFIASFGWQVAAIYAASGIVLGVAGGIAMRAMRVERWLTPFARELRGDLSEPSNDSGACGCGCKDEIPSKPLVTAPLRVLPASQPLVLRAAPAGSVNLGALQPVSPIRAPGAGPIRGREASPTDQGCGCSAEKAAPEPSGGGCGCGCGDKPDAGGKEACCGGKRSRPQGTLAFATAESWRIYRQVVVYLAIALVIGAGIHGFLPEGFFVEFFQGGAWWHVPAAVGIGFPLYASANATVPILETLVDKGVPLGTAMAFIMSAVGVSLPELIILKRVMSVRLLAVFTLVVCVGVGLVGVLFNTLPAFR